jgi:hypothetical protein
MSVALLLLVVLSVTDGVTVAVLVSEPVAVAAIVQLTV